MPSGSPVSATPPTSRPLRGALRLLLQAALGAVLIFQLQILFRGGLRLPEFALTALAGRAERAGFTLKADAVWLDPRGHLRIVAPRIGLAGDDSPFATARGVSLRISRRALLKGEVAVLRAEVAGLGLTLPARHSPTGMDQPLLEAGEFRLARPDAGSAWLVEQASARVLSIPTGFAGVLPSPPSGEAAEPSAKLGPSARVRSGLARASVLYRRLSGLPLDSIRHLDIALANDGLAVAARVPALLVPEHPALPAGLAGSTLRGARVVLTAPFADAEGVSLNIEAEALASPAAFGLNTGPLALRLQTAGEGGLHLDLAVSRWEKTDIPLPTPPLVAAITYHPDSKRLEGVLGTRAADAPWALTVDGEPALRVGRVTAKGELTPALLEFARPFLPEKARPILELTDPVRIAVSADFDGRPGATPARVVAHAASGRAVAKDVHFDRAAAVLVYEPGEKRFRADELLLVQDDSRAEGDYAMATDTLAFRFRLGGRLRPMGIEGWFSGWWDNFWDNFHFGPTAPEAEVDIRGRWRHPHETTVFVGAASGPMRLREQELDALAMRIQVNAGGSVDLLGFRGTHGANTAEGAFDRVLATPGGDWASMHFDIRSDFPISALPALFPKDGDAIAQPFELRAPPRIHLRGVSFGPGSTTPGRQSYQLAVATDAPLRYHGFPLEHLSLDLNRQGDDLRLENIRAGFAGGLATGRAVVSGPERERWLAFDLRLADARLELALTHWREFQAARARSDAGIAEPAGGGPPAEVAPPPASMPVFPPASASGAAPHPEGRLQLTLAATGPLDDPLGFGGRGEAHIADADLARIRLLGGFSTLLSELGIGFTTVKLTGADARFDVSGRRVHFDSLELSGPSSLVQAKGDYLLPDGRLEFTAKVRPFERREGLLSSTAGWVLSPLTHALEVRLGGTLDEPDWFFSYGPTSLIRRITGNGPKSPASEAPASPPP